MKYKKALAALLMFSLLGLRSPGNVAYGSPQTTSKLKKQTLEFHTFNDNTGVKWIDKIFLPGDDMGYTWGSKLCYGIDLKNNHLNLDYFTNLYTRRRMDIPVIPISEDGDVLLPQDFLDECVFTATLDNKKQDKFLYQDASLGFLSLSSSDKDFFLKASSQQKMWHKFLSNFVPIFLPDNQENGSSQFGMLFGFHQGLYLPLKICNWMNFSADLKAGGRLSTIPHASYLDFATSVELTFGKQKGLVAKLNLGSDMKLYENGLRTTLSFGSSVGTRNFQIGINFIKPFGDAFPMYKFDDKRQGEYASIGYDLIGETFVKLKF